MNVEMSMHIKKSPQPCVSNSYDRAGLLLHVLTKAAGRIASSVITPHTFVALQIIPAYQVDGLHPSPVGMLSMARCISPMLDEIMETATSSYSDRILHGLEHLFSRKALLDVV